MTLAELAAAAVAELDGNWFDTSTFIGAVIYGLVNRRRAPPGRAFFSLDTGLDVFNGMALVPLAFLSLAVFSTHAVAALVQFNRLVLTGAAVLALFALLKAP